MRRSENMWAGEQKEGERKLERGREEERKRGREGERERLCLGWVVRGKLRVKVRLTCIDVVVDDSKQDVRMWCWG